MGVRDHQFHAFEAALDQTLQEARSERLGLRRADAETDDLAPPVGVHRHGDYRRDRDDPAAIAHLVCRKHGISSATFYKWKAKFGGLDVSDARRLKALEDENA